MSERAAVVAIDLGAESCRVSLLRWRGTEPSVRIVHRFPNAPVDRGDGLRWDLDRICRELDSGLRACAEIAMEGIASIGVTGWAVDYVRIDRNGGLQAQPFCYRDPRNSEAMAAVHAIIPAEELYRISGIQIQPLNTIYQLYADKLSGVEGSSRWVNLPEYILHWLGAPLVAEYSNATHTGLVNSVCRGWAKELFYALGLDFAAVPELVAPGTRVGVVANHLRSLKAFQQTQLIAPACHDTASAVAGIPANGGSWAYISSGTWSLIGTQLQSPHNTQGAYAAGFTNLGGIAGNVLFHRGIPGMWLLRQCMEVWEREAPCSVEGLVRDARTIPTPPYDLDVEDPAFVTPGDMPERINQQLVRRGLNSLPSGCEFAAEYAALIFHSLAHRYGALLAEIQMLTSKKIDRLCIVGGGSRNGLLNELTEAATQVPVTCCSPESSTVGNFAVQCARLEHPDNDLNAQAVAAFATQLIPALEN